MQDAREDEQLSVDAIRRALYAKTISQ